MKKLWIVLAAMIMLFGTNSISASSVSSGDYVYTLLEDGTVEITGYSGSEPSLVIPDNIDGHPVTSIGEHAFYDHRSLSSIQLPGTLTKLGDYAFMNCSGISNIELPDSITEVGGNPFGNCDIQFTISQNHPYLANVDGTLISKPDKRILYVPVNAKSYVFPKDIAIIGNGAFYCCKDISGIEIPNSVTSIDPYAFYNCSGLTSLIIPDSVTGIGDYAFFGCTGLSEVDIPENVISMGNNPFCSCNTKIVLPSEHQYLQILDGVLFSKPDERLIYCPKTIESYRVPDGTKVISDYAFYGCEKLTGITLPDSITEIGVYAFTGCDDLVILTGQNTYAAQYCEDNNIHYTSNTIDSEPDLSAVEGKPASGVEDSAADQEEWVCPECGNVATDDYCYICGAKKPSTEWICPTCGQVADGKLCSDCGTPKPEGDNQSAETDDTEVIMEEKPEENAPETADNAVPEPVPEEKVNEEGIHRYEYCIEDCTWNQAYQKAKDRGGYLVHINSKEEYEFILSEIAQKNLSDKKFFIGGRRNLDSTDYYWTDANNVTYGDVLNAPGYWGILEWLPGEPTYKDGDTVEAYMDIFYYADVGTWVWNDVPDDILAVAPYYSGTIGYIVEYNS